MNTALADPRTTSGLVECREVAGYPAKAIFEGQQNYWQAISLTEGWNLEFKSFFIPRAHITRSNVQSGLMVQIPHLYP